MIKVVEVATNSRQNRWSHWHVVNSWWWVHVCIMCAEIIWLIVSALRTVPKATSWAAAETVQEGCYGTGPARA